MILKALYDYYFRCKALYGDEVPPLGFEKITLDYVIVLSKEGSILAILTNQKTIAPRATIRTSNSKPNILWDEPKYILNYDGDNGIDGELNEYCLEMVKLVREITNKFPNRQDFSALNSFYNNKMYETIVERKEWRDIIKGKKSISFQLYGETIPVCNYSYELNEGYILERYSENTVAKCLITGEIGPIMEISGGISLGIATNGKLVGFQKEKGYDSYGKIQGENAPISVKAEFAYTQALKMLDMSDNKIVQYKKIKNKIVLERTLYVWSSANTKELLQEVENPLAWLCPKVDNPDDVQAAISIYRSLKQHGVPNSYADTLLYFLELTPTTKGRIAVSFWSECSVMRFVDIANKHFIDMDIAPIGGRIRFDAVSMVNSVSLYKKEEQGKIIYERPNNLIDDVFRSIVTGMPYSGTLFSLALDRIRAEQNHYDGMKLNREKERGEYIIYQNRDLERAAIIKAFLNRRSNNYTFTNMLDTTYDNIGYLCGRLFAVLQYTQEAANYKDKGKWESSLRSKYMNAAMLTPASVFPAILANSNYYLDKLDRIIGWIEQIKQEIMNQIRSVDSFPATLSHYDQGRFFVGYYQQRYSLLNKEDNKQKENI